MKKLLDYKWIALAWLLLFVVLLACCSRIIAQACCSGKPIEALWSSGPQSWSIIGWGKLLLLACSFGLLLMARWWAFPVYRLLHKFDSRCTAVLTAGFGLAVVVVFLALMQATRNLHNLGWNTDDIASIVGGARKAILGEAPGMPEDAPEADMRASAGDQRGVKRQKDIVKARQVIAHLQNLAPFLILSPILLLTLRFLLASIPGWLMRRLRGHAIVVGLGPTGRQLCEEFLNPKDPRFRARGVIAVDCDGLLANRGYCEDRGVLYLPATGVVVNSLIENAALRHARWLALADEQDARNLNTFLEWRSRLNPTCPTPEGEKITLSAKQDILLHMGSQEVMQGLAHHPDLGQAVLSELKLTVHPFNTNRNAAADLFGPLLIPNSQPWLPLAPPEAGQKAAGVEIVLLGHGYTGSALLESLAQIGHRDYQGALPRSDEMIVHVIDRERLPIPGATSAPGAHGYGLRIPLKNPDAALVLKPVRLDVETEEAFAYFSDIAVNARNAGRRLVWVICLGDDQFNTGLALRLHAALQLKHDDIFIRTPRHRGLAELLERDLKNYPNIHPFGTLQETCGLNDIVDPHLQNRVRVAEGAYQCCTSWYESACSLYKARRRAELERLGAEEAGRTACGGVRVDFPDRHTIPPLSDLVRQSLQTQSEPNWTNNRHAAVHFDIKLASVGIHDLRDRLNTLAVNPRYETITLPRAVQIALEGIAKQTNDPLAILPLRGWLADTQEDDLEARILRLRGAWLALWGSLPDDQLDEHLKGHFDIFHERELRQWLLLQLLIQEWVEFSNPLEKSLGRCHREAPGHFHNLVYYADDPTKDPKPKYQENPKAFRDLVMLCHKADNFALPPKDKGPLLDRLARFEHSRWWMEKQLAGIKPAKHACMVESDQLPAPLQMLDHIQVAALAQLELEHRMEQWRKESL